MYKKLRKICAWALAVVTVITVVPASSLVMADELDATANAEVEQGKIYFKIPNADGQVLVTTDKDTDEENTQTITVTDEKTTLTDKDGNQTDVTLTENGYCLEITDDVESVANIEIIPAEGYEVGTYHILSDTGDVMDEPEISPENKYDITISKDVQVAEILFNAVETENENGEEIKTPEIKNIPEQETTNDDKVTTDENKEESDDSDIVIPDDEITAVLNGTYGQTSTKRNARSLFSLDSTEKYTDEEKERLSLEYRRISAANSLATSRATTWCSVTPGTEIAYGDWSTNRFRVDKEGVISEGYCAEPNKDTPEGVFQAYKLANDQIKAILMFAPGGPLYYQAFWDTYGQNPATGGTDGHNNPYSLAHACIGYVYSGSTTGLSDVDVGEIQGYIGLCSVDYCKQQKEWNQYTAYIAYNNDQDIVWLEKVPTGSGYIVKSSSNTSLTSGNGYYNLTGATYNIYKSQSDAQNNRNAISGKQFRIESNSGRSNTVELDAGTYWIREVSGADGTGYTTSNAIYQITITAGQRDVNLTPSGGITNTPKTATINLYKTPTNPVCVQNNDNYSLAGAVYSIYTNEACTSLKTTATTNENGEFSVTGLPLDEYWVKETKASQGYQLDTNKYYVNATQEGSDAVRVFTVESQEVPFLDPSNLLLRKLDSNTNGAPEDQGTLEGAQYRVKFYGVDVTSIADNTDPATLGYPATRTWVLKTYTLSNGSAALIFDNAYKVSGDAFYYTDSGNVAFPYGIVTIQEIKSPNGYLLNDDIIVQKISDANGGNTTTIVDHVSTQKEDSLTLKLVKTQYNTDYAVPGATFKWTRPDGTTNTYTTDKNGAIEFHGLTWGKHTIEEIGVPDGYAVNTNKITFTVAQDNTITFDKQYDMSETNGVITLSLNSKKNLDVDYTNKPAPFDLKIHKINNHDFALSGAEFTLYSDEKCTKVVDVQVTGTDGELTFENLIPYETYWMKETDAPAGYRIPINEDGSDIVWKISVASVPVKDQFTFYVNDKGYTVNSEGSIWIDGTKADRVCNMTVVNEVGMRLPNTGSSMMILLLIAGVALMGGAIVISRKRGDKNVKAK